jgi:ADP-ribosylglycohydrolase
MKDTVRNAVMASFIADAISLGVHWVYSVAKIREKYGRLDKMVPPELVPYHRGKSAGEFTHYGDQMMVLLESVAGRKRFDPEDFSRQWQDLFSSYNGYVDQATKATLDNLSSGSPPEKAGSGSSDLAGASRTPVVFAAGSMDEQQLVAWARQQATMTHNSDDVINTSEWIARTALRLFEGQSASKAMLDSLNTMSKGSGLSGLHRAVDAGLESRNMDTGKAIESFGQMCALPAALPCAVHLVAKYENDFKEAMVENIMAGGDSSARGVLAGFLIAAHQGVGCVPQEWCNGMAAYERISTLITE